jgi:hypothetical protein
MEFRGAKGLGRAVDVRGSAPAGRRRAERLEVRAGGGAGLEAREVAVVCGLNDVRRAVPAGRAPQSG